MEPFASDVTEVFGTSFSGTPSSSSALEGDGKPDIIFEVPEPDRWSTAAQCKTGPAVGGTGAGQGRFSGQSGYSFPGPAVLPNVANEIPEPDSWRTAAQCGTGLAVGWRGTGSAAMRANFADAAAGSRAAADERCDRPKALDRCLKVLVTHRIVEQQKNR